MKTLLYFLIIISMTSILANPPAEYEAKFLKEVEKINSSSQRHLAEVKLKRNLEKLMKAQQQAGKLEEYLSLQKFLNKLNSGDFSKKNTDLTESTDGQKIYKQYQDDLIKIEKAKKARLDQLKISFHKALNKKVISLTKAGKIDEALEFQKLEKKYPVSVKQISSKEKVSSKAPTDASKEAPLWISEKATYKISSNYKDFTVSPELLSVEDPSKSKMPFAFHTKSSKDPYIIIDLGKIKEIDSLAIYNHRNPKLLKRANGLTIWLSNTPNFPKHNRPVYKIESLNKTLDINLPSSSRARYIKLGLSGNKRILHLAHVKVMGWE